MSTTTTRTDLYARVTAHILADLERGVRPWLQPWHADPATGRVTRPLRHNGTPYRGVNVLILWGEATAKGYASPTWMTFQQATRWAPMSARASMAPAWSMPTPSPRPRPMTQGEDVERRIPFLKTYVVFNVEQIADLPAQYAATPAPPGDPLPLLERAEQFFAATGAVIRHGGDRAYYAPGPDVIHLPPPEAFRDAESYAAIKGHEIVHWTRHRTRLNRDFGGTALRRCGLRPRRVDRRVRRGVSLCRPGHHARAARGPRRLPGELAARAAGRHARDLHRRRPRATRRGLPPRLTGGRRLRPCHPWPSGCQAMGALTHGRRPLDAACTWRILPGRVPDVGIHSGTSARREQCWAAS